ncbi:hypothetical protein K402DRAFT_421485 [Aulographum hederae CBS 113979]|uniref:Rhodopsin domain-containing protein n=1 Tax=Aulographum hederae CBS 113979 TaxID=1176131 RepID=A0A6G1GZX9_9PEZI|nr:hypothetical protein K402DRAFT_421485 [Aulographum hederae CBS 113979]
MQDRSGEVLAVAILFACLTWITVLLRVYVRGYLLRSFGLDDWTMVATQIFFTGYLICQILGVVYGTGKHRSSLKEEDAEQAVQYWWYCELFYIQAALFVKVSLGIFLHRVAVRRVHLWLLRFTVASTALFGTCYFFLALFQCSPISFFWTRFRAEPPSGGQCLDNAIIIGATYAASGLNAIADWTFGLLPIFIVYTLAMSRRQKIMVTCILALGAVGSTATVIRLQYVRDLGNISDFLYSTVDIAIWSTVEPGIGITAACIATLRPLLKQWSRTAVTLTAEAKTRSKSYSRKSKQYRIDKDRISIPLTAQAPSDRSPYAHHPGWFLDRLSTDRFVPPSHGTTTTTITGNAEPKAFDSPRNWSPWCKQDSGGSMPGINKSMDVSVQEDDDSITMDLEKSGRGTPLPPLRSLSPVVPRFFDRLDLDWFPESSDVYSP